MSGMNIQGTSGNSLVDITFQAITIIDTGSSIIMLKAEVLSYIIKAFNTFTTCRLMGGTQ